MTFQSDAGMQGRQFAEQCRVVLRSSGFELHGRHVVGEVGVEIDEVAVSSRGESIWFEFKGSVQGKRPGLLRTDTMKKAVANGALLRTLPEHKPYIVLTSHLPVAGSALAMLETSLRAGYLSDVICLYDPGDAGRIRDL